MRPLRFERQQRTPTSTSTPTRASNASLDSIALGGGEPSTSRSGGSTPGLSDYFGAPQDNSAAFDDISGASTCLGGEAESAESRVDAPPPSSRYPIQRPASRLQQEVQRGDDEQLGHRSPVDVAPPQVPPSRRQQPVIPLQQQQQQPIPLQQQPNPQQQQLQQQQPIPLQQQPNPQQQQQQQQQPINPLQLQPNPQLQQQQPIPLQQQPNPQQQQQQQQQPIPLQQQPSLQLEPLPSAQQAISQTQDISRVANTQQPVLPKQQHYLATRAPESSLGSVSGTDAPVAVDCSVTPLPVSNPSPPSPPLHPPLHSIPLLTITPHPIPQTVPIHPTTTHLSIFQLSSALFLLSIPVQRKPHQTHLYTTSQQHSSSLPILSIPATNHNSWHSNTIKPAPHPRISPTIYSCTVPRLPHHNPIITPSTYHQLSGDKYSAWLPSKHTKLLLDNQTATVLTQLLLTSDFFKVTTAYVIYLYLVYVTHGLC